MSRPWKVALTVAACHRALVRLTAASTPPSASAAGSSSPLSGPTSRPPGVDRAMPRRRLPTPGSTTARCTARGRCGTVWASRVAPPDTSCGATSWLTSSTRTCGASRASTPCTIATNPSASPVVSGQRDPVVAGHPAIILGPLRGAALCDAFPRCAPRLRPGAPLSPGVAAALLSGPAAGRRGSRWRWRGRPAGRRRRRVWPRRGRWCGPATVRCRRPATVQSGW